MSQETAARAESVWTPALVRWVLRILPEWLDPDARLRLDELRAQWDRASLGRLAERAKSDRTRVIETLSRTPWHADVQAEADRLFAEQLKLVDHEEAFELARLANESAQLCLVEQEALEPAARCDALLGERRNVMTMRGLLSSRIPKDADEETKKRDEKVLRRLERIARKLHDQADEALLTRRLEAIFGRRQVGWFNKLTFFALLLLLVILIVEPMVDHGTAFKDWLLYTDTAICGLFLWEFGWRVALAPRRFRWFLRHFLTDFVPALPFALLMADGMSQARFLRFLRLPMYARYLRFLKPFVAIFRLIVFWVRGMDRLVQSLAPFLNRQIVLFEPEERGREERSFRDLGVEHEVTTSFERLSPQLRREHAPVLLAALQEQVEVYLDPELKQFQPDEQGEQGRLAASSRVVRAEDLVATLEGIEAEDIEAALPPASVRSLGRILRAMDLPLIRWLPFVGGLVRAARGATPADRVAHAVRRLGGYGRTAMGGVIGWADLSGVLTPTQILDRISTALMKSTQRPAVRLLLFGGFFVLVKLLFEAVPALHNEGLIGFLDKFVATPLLVLGTVCLVLLLLARWLKRIAGEATDRLLRRAEARYVNLLELLRRYKEDEDREAVVHRLGAIELRDAASLHMELATAMDELRGRRMDKAEVTTARARHLALILLDYQDGALLHATDTKVAEQFLSHPDMWSLRSEHLAVSKREERRLGKLDLVSGGLFSGAYLWFDLVTHALAVKIARLCSTYNIHLIPLDEWERSSEEEKARHRALVAGTEELSAEPRRGLGYRGSHFHALHFFDFDERWVREIDEVFGCDVVERLLKDRSGLVREVFGSRGLHRLPVAQRSFNPFDYYETRVGGGRILFMPLRLIGGWLKLTWMMLRMIVRSAREILDPRVKAQEELQGYVPFSVARRKIRRLKKPLLLAAIETAARIDPQYLGLESDGSEPARKGYWEHDLARAEPTPREVARVRRMRESVRERMLYFPRFLEKLGSPDLDACARRRLSCAFAMDEGGLARLAAAEERARAWLYAAGDEQTPPSGALYMAKHQRNKRAVKAGYRVLLGFLGKLSRKERRYLQYAKRHGLGDFAVVCQAFAEAEPKRPTSAAVELAERFMADREVFARRLETLQTILALISQDLAHYEELIFCTGEYGGSAPESPEPPPPPPTRNGNASTNGTPTNGTSGEAGTIARATRETSDADEAAE